MEVAYSALAVIMVMTAGTVFGVLMTEELTFKLYAFRPKKFADLADNRLTFGVIDGELEIGFIFFGFGFWIRGY